MKKILYFLMATFLIVSACDKNDGDDGPQLNWDSINAMKPVMDSLEAGAGYANDVYYSMESGVLKVVPRNNWDIAFSTGNRDASILINSANGVELYLWKGNGHTIANFDDEVTLDPNTKKQTTNLDTSSWRNHSAFEQNNVPSDPYDQGWGKYDMTTHNVKGDSVYILKFANGTYKKIAIIERIASSRKFIFKFADLAAGSPAETVEIDGLQYASRNFIYYSISNKQIIDREPDGGMWDIVFSKYWSNAETYNVSGILTNEGLKTAKLGVSDTSMAYNAVTYKTKVTGIGSNWKQFDHISNLYTIVNPFYYLQTVNDKYYRIQIKKFDAANGKIVFEKKLLFWEKE